MAAIIRMPEVLAGATEGAIQSWLVAEGEHVEFGAPLAEIETEKAVVEFTAEFTGVVARRLVAEGGSLAVGAPMLAVLEPGEPSEAVAALLADAGLSAGVPGAVEAPEADAGPADARAEAGPGDGDAGAGPADRGGARRFASPIVRRLAAERGLELAAIVGSGPEGRIVRRDLEGAAPPPAAAVPTAAPVAGPAPVLEPAPQPAPGIAAVDASAPSAAAPPMGRGSGASRAGGPREAAYTDLPADAMRRTIARRLVESKTTIPHFTMTRHLQLDELLALREQVNALGGQRVSVNDFVVKAVALAHRAVPEAASIWQDGVLRRFEDIDVAVAVALDGGLVTPVLRDVDRLSLGALAAASAAAIERARAGALAPGELVGGTITVSNLGMHGIDEFAAIINPPQSAILAVGRAAQQPVVRDGAIEIATMMSVTLSGDHRVMDGALAARWFAAFAGLIERPLGILA